MLSASRIAALDNFRTACHRGTQWLLALRNPDGSLGPTDKQLCYYRLPWTLHLVAEDTTAENFLEWIERNMLDSQGEFRGITPRGIFDQHYGSYPLACLLTGAQRLGRADLVKTCMPRLLSWQSPENGGFYGTRTPFAVQGEQELFPTAQGGMSLLAAGQIEAASRAGRWLEQLWQQQPDREHRLFQVTDSTGALITEYSGEQAVLYVTEKNDPWQHHYNGGIAAALLAELYLATADNHWLHSARNYQDFSMTTDACQFRSMQTCKSGWGSGLLWKATSDPIYQDWTYRMGNWFVEHQFADGHWENTKFWNPHPSLSDNVEITTEFVMHLAHILQFLEPKKEAS